MDWTKQLKDDLARLRYERARYAERAAKRRQDAIDLRRKRDFLGALKADSRASEYRNTRNQLTAEINRLRQEHGLR